MRKLGTVALVVSSLVVAVAGFSHAGQAGSRGGGSGPLINSSDPVTVDGAVVQFIAGPGQGLPELQVEGTDGDLYTFILGPLWFLTEQGFTAQAGDVVTATAFPCPLCETGLAVITVANLTTGVTLTLRDSDGVPLWTKAGAANTQSGSTVKVLGANRGGNGSGGQGASRAGSPPNASGAGPNSQWRWQEHLVPDLSRMTTLTGTVVSASVAAGEGQGSLVLDTVDGELSFVLSPLWVLIRSGFTPSVGDALTITAAPMTVDGEEVWVAITIVEPTSGLELVFRDPATGLPVGMRRSGRS